MQGHEEESMTERRFLLVFVLLISALFVAMIRPFLVSLTLAALFTGLLQPAYDWLLPRFGGRKGLTSATVLVVVLLVIIMPLVLFLGVVTTQAVNFTQGVQPWVVEQVQHRDQIARQLVERFSALEWLLPYREQITARAAEIAGKAGGYLAASLSSVAGATVSFLFYLVVMLYAMFWFLIDGRALLGRILDYMPLPQEDKQQLLSLFASVTRAIMKGTFIVAIIQGALGGAAFAVAGIDGSAFWGTLMAVCSLLPGFGAAIVWVPAAAYLVMNGQTTAATGVALWCALVVGTIDNILRPRLVGRDISMPELLIFLSTLGGVYLFGAVGVLFGPIIAALFQSVWEMYGHTVSGTLPTGAPDPPAKSP